MSDSGWFDELYRTSYSRLVLIVFGLTGNLGDAEEAVQDAFARGYAKRSTLAGVDNREAWLTTVALNAARRRFRRSRLFTSRSSDDHDEELRSRQGRIRAAVNPAEFVPSRLDLVDALARVPADQRQVLVMFHLADLPMDEIAARLGVPLGTVKSRLARGRTALAALLADTPEGSRFDDRGTTGASQDGEPR
ncbi:sigma-70 family RNA polymerase sigma factor [Nakamurella sp. A5-74]|uniref:Sigma-70 family RNA polymerase sigma factor n=1 Tax=Nakamurella sp. A5-74 TaxID=3158264 RepID=A0AAU8DW48_9ACTN